MRYQSLAWLPVVIVLGLNCSDKITSPQYLNQFPLRVGMFWDYQSRNYTLHRRIVDVHKGPQDTWWYQLETALSDKDDPLGTVIRFTFLAFDRNQLREYEYRDCAAIYNVLLQPPLSLGNSWLKYSSGTCVTGPCDSLGRCPVVFRIQIYDQDSIIAYSDIMTPASYFRNCIVIQETGGAHEFRTASFKPGVGFVRYEGFYTGRYNSNWDERVDFILTDFGRKTVSYLSGLNP